MALIEWATKKNDDYLLSNPLLWTQNYPVRFIEDGQFYALTILLTLGLWYFEIELLPIHFAHVDFVFILAYGIWTLKLVITTKSQISLYKNYGAFNVLNERKSQKISVLYTVFNRLLYVGCFLLAYYALLPSIDSVKKSTIENIVRAEYYMATQEGNNNFSTKEIQTEIDALGKLEIEVESLIVDQFDSIEVFKSYTQLAQKIMSDNKIYLAKTKVLEAYEPKLTFPLASLGVDRADLWEQVRGLNRCEIWFWLFVAFCIVSFPHCLFRNYLAGEEKGEGLWDSEFGVYVKSNYLSDRTSTLLNLTSSLLIFCLFISGFIYYLMPLLYFIINSAILACGGSDIGNTSFVIWIGETANWGQITLASWLNVQPNIIEWLWSMFCLFIASVYSLILIALFFSSAQKIKYKFLQDFFAPKEDYNEDVVIPCMAEKRSTT